jgi:membrane fusion protein, multidrug efflux system
MRTLHQVGVTLGIVVLAVGGWVWLATPYGSGADQGQGADGPARARVVEVALARSGTVVEEVEAVGTTRAFQSIDVVSMVAGRVARIAFTDGQRVAEGDLLVELDSERERAEVREAEATLANVRQQLDRARQLLQSRNVPEARVDELTSELAGAEARLAAAQARLNDREVRAPFDGVVGLRRVSVGSYVDDGVVLTTLDDLSVVELDFAVPEGLFGSVRPGQRVIATGRAYGGAPFEGVVASVGTRIDPATRSFEVRAEMPNPDARLPDGLFLTVRLQIAERDGAVLVPEAALIVEGRDRYVFAVRDGVAVRTDVETGQRLAGEVEVTAGLEPGTPVVVKGQQQLRDGAPVRVAEPAPAATS